MKVEKFDGTAERTILTAMITNQAVLAAITSRWEGRMFSSKWANLVGSWCVSHFNKYSQPPGRDIVSRFASWAETRRDKETVELIERFLESLSEEYEQEQVETNSQYVIDQASTYFNRVRLSNLAEAIQGDLDSGEIEKADDRITAYGRISLGEKCGVDIFRDPAEIRAAFVEDDEKPIIEYDQGLGDFFGNNLARDAFIAFMAPEKVGKSWWLIDIAWRAILQRRRVAFFEVGDMSANQVKRRFYSRMSKFPMYSPTRKWPAVIKVPTSIRKPPAQASKSQFPMPIVEYEEEIFDKKLSSKISIAASERLAEKRIKSKDSFFRMACHPNSTINVKGIEAEILQYEREGWGTPDVVVIDYADILAPPAGNMEVRDQINTTWKQLRSLSQKLHCLVVTATQADAASYDKSLMSRINFSEDKRKLSHVTGVVGINVTGLEKEKGICRLNWIVLREGDYSPSRCCYVAGCLALGNPSICSVY